MESVEGGKTDTIQQHSLTDFPKTLQKKVTLLQHFRSYLEADGLENTMAEVDSQPANPNIIPVYVKKWNRTKHAIMFRLSNKVVQVLFQDKTQVVLSSDTKSFIYVDK
jgi:polo-like kinase 1